VPYIDNLVRDFRYGLRALRKNPIFTATVIAQRSPGLAGGDPRSDPGTEDRV